MYYKQADEGSCIKMHTQKLIGYQPVSLIGIEREKKRHGLSNMQIAAANVVQLQLIG